MRWFWFNKGQMTGINLENVNCLDIKGDIIFICFDGFSKQISFDSEDEAKKVYGHMREFIDEG